MQQRDNHTSKLIDDTGLLILQRLMDLLGAVCMRSAGDLASFSPPRSSLTIYSQGINLQAWDFSFLFRFQMKGCSWK